MGAIEMTSLHCTPAGDSITGGRMTLVAANGDELDLEYSGTGPFPSGLPIGAVIHVDGEFTIVGGTGRFESAMGSGTFDAHVVFEGFGDPEWAASWRFAGTIGY